MIIIKKYFSVESTPYSQNSPAVFAENLTPTNSIGSEKNWVRVRFGKSDTPVPYYNLPEGSKSNGYIGMPLNPPTDKDRLADLSPHNPDGTPIIENHFNGDHSPVAAGLIGAGILTAGYLLHRKRRKRDK